MGTGQRARQVKHAAFVMKRAASARLEEAADSVRSRRVGHAAGPLDLERHREADGEYALEYFLYRTAPGEDASAKVPRRIFAAWTGDNAMTPNRLRNIESLRTSNPTVPVEFVTADRIADWLVPGRPLHPAYADLSAIHRSDYLRAYLLHHHGGGWSDLKFTTQDWAPFFDAMDDDAGAWVLGYPERRSRDVVYLNSALGRDMRNHFASMAANCAFVVRPRTPFTTAWLEEVEARLDYYRRALSRNPAVDPFGREGGYPLPWSILQGHVFQPLQVKYADHVRLDERMRPGTTDNR